MGVAHMGVMERVAPRRKKAVALAPAPAIEANRLLRGDCIAEMAKLPYMAHNPKTSCMMKAFWLFLNAITLKLINPFALLYHW